jgi:hypothetical protein
MLFLCTLFPHEFLLPVITVRRQQIETIFIPVINQIVDLIGKQIQQAELREDRGPKVCAGIIQWQSSLRDDRFSCWLVGLGEIGISITVSKQHTLT